MTNVKLEWRDELTPVATAFDDPYYSRYDGRLEAGHVFINGNDLPERWAQGGDFTIAELGFGTGLNFLETKRQFLETAPETSTLTFVSFEKFVLNADDIRKALSRWPELTESPEEMLSNWPPVDGLNTFQEDRVTLKLFVGDANELVTQMQDAADAWYLDGFDPAKNPELWNEDLMAHVALKTKPDGTFATYTAAGWVRRMLGAAGFEVSKRKGYGRKRDMSVGTRASI